jgi:UDP-2-acetamido-2,6-beta-L-arabino-hexul-4-ose reductase
VRVAITGASGFIGSHLRLRLQESQEHEVIAVVDGAGSAALQEALDGADWVFHLSGIDCRDAAWDFHPDDVGFTETLCGVLERSAQPPRVVYAVSDHSDLANAGDPTARSAAARLRAYGRRHDVAVAVYRLPQVFGKWARPLYNSDVATLCHQIARGQPIAVHDPEGALRLMYVDDLMTCWQTLLREQTVDESPLQAVPVWDLKVAALVEILESFSASRADLMMPPVGRGLVRALYATYVSHLPPGAFSYTLPRHEDRRGRFVEFLKTPDCGQFSYFTAHPGVTRGEHYHHTKTEKFLVIQGTAHFGFRHILTGATHERTVHGRDSAVVETVPGWTHSITNVGDDELIVLLWANEVFDRAAPDTHPLQVKP